MLMNEYSLNRPVFFSSLSISSQLQAVRKGPDGRLAVSRDSSSTCRAVWPVSVSVSHDLSFHPKLGRCLVNRGPTFRPETDTVSIEPYLSSLTLLNRIGLFPIYFPSFSFHARRKSSGSENAMKPYFALGG